MLNSESHALHRYHGYILHKLESDSAIIGLVKVMGASTSLDRSVALMITVLASLLFGLSCSALICMLGSVM